MRKFPDFEASLLAMLVDKCNADREGLGRLLGSDDLDGRSLVEEAVRMQLVDERRLARLISQYWELPLVDISFPYRRFLVHFSRPIDDLLEHDLLPLEIEPGTLTVVSHYLPDAEVVSRIEKKRSATLTLYVSALTPVKEALLRLREEVKRFRAAEPVDCGLDKELFYAVTAEGWPAIVRETVAGSTILVEFGKGRRITKTVERVEATEPAAVASLLLGKSMSATLGPDEDVRSLVDDFVETVGLFDGDLSEAILKLRVAQIMFDGDETT